MKIFFILIFILTSNNLEATVFNYFSFGNWVGHTGTDGTAAVACAARDTSPDTVCSKTSLTPSEDPCNTQSNNTYWIYSEGAPNGTDVNAYVYCTVGSCQVGTSADITTGECTEDGSCPTGQHYDIYLESCVSNQCQLPLGFQIKVNHDTGVPPSAVCDQYCIFSPSGDPTPYPSDPTKSRSLVKNTGENCDIDNTGNADSPGDSPVDDTGGAGNDASNDPETPGTGDDGNNTDEGATDENQERISEQLTGIESILQDIELDTSDIAGNTQTIDTLLQEISDGVNNDSQGVSGTGSSDEFSDGDGLCEAGEDCVGDDLANTVIECDVPPSCDGDIIACSILLQSYHNACLWKDLENAPDMTAQIYQPDDELIYWVNSDITQMLNQSGFIAGNNCPPDNQITLQYGVFNISYQPFCDLASTIAPLTLIIASLISIRNVAGALI